MFGKKLLLVTGKGGIGKTLVSACLGQMAAEAGLRVLIVENTTIDQISPVFGLPPVGHQTTEIRPGLFCINLNPDDNFRDYVVKHLGQRRLFESVLSHRVVQSFISMIPGLAQLMILGRLFYECELAPEPRYDLVVFDAPASGHFMSLMTTPDAVLGSNLGGPLRRETERVRGFLADPGMVGTVYVAAPEDLVVSETLDFLPRLEASSPVSLTSLVLNRMPTWLLSSVESLPEGPARNFAVHHRRAADQALSALRTGLLGCGDRLATLPVTILADRGAIEEPLSPGFGRAFLGEGFASLLPGGRFA